MAYQSRVVLVLHERSFSKALSEELLTDNNIEIDEYRQLSRGAFVDDHIDLVVLEVRENSFSNITSMIAMMDSLDSPPKIVLLSDDKSIKRVKEFAELDVVAILPSGFPAELIALQLKSILQLNEEIISLNDKLKNARNVAMLSMSASSQLGEVVRFQERSYAISDFHRLSEMLMDSVSLLGARCSGVIHVGSEMVYFGDHDNREAIIHLLQANRNTTRFVDVDDGTLIYFQQIWVYLTDMPVPGSEEYGQLKDSIFPLVESAGQRIHTIIAERAATVAEHNKSWFLKNVSMSFRQPMSSIMTGLQLIRRHLTDDLNTREGQVVGLLESSANQLADLIEDLLALSDAENIKVHKQKFSVHKELDEIVGLYQGWADNKNTALTIVIEPDSLEVFTDPKHFKQVLRSLLSNAVKYTEDGKIDVQIRKLGDGPSELLEVVVSDTGKGMDLEAVQHYLKPFVELDRKIVQEGDGAGLGLSVVVQLMEQLGGNLSIESEPEKGSCFTLSLPVYMPEDADKILF